MVFNIMKTLKNSLPLRISLYLNIILIYILIYSGYKLGLLEKFLSVFYRVMPESITNTLPTEVQLDNLISNGWWQEEVKYQAIISQNQKYNACLFGDSISSMLGNHLGNNSFNFALSAMSTVSLVEQLKILNTAGVKCSHAIIAIGTNDAMYFIKNEQFIANMKAIITTVKKMGANRVTLLPAFYSTVEASYNPGMAGTITRVEEINVLIRQVADSEKVIVAGEVIKPLFQGQSLKENLTTDGVHLNAEGRKIYRDALLKLIL